MLVVQDIRDRKDTIVESLKKRNWSEEQISVLDKVVVADDKRRSLQTENDHNLNKVNTASKQIGGLMRDGKHDEAESLKSSIAEIKSEIKVKEEEIRAVKLEIEELLLGIPNTLHADVAFGKGEEDNVVVKDWADELPILGEGALPHWELADKYNLIDFELGVKITGAGFPVFRGKGSKLCRALINFFLEEAEIAGYEEFAPPLMVNAESAKGTGNLPDKEGQMYHMEKDGFYLIPTAEVPLTNIFRGDIIKNEDLPLKVTGYTPCFRREAGSYGSHVKGLNRVHQFDKIEIVQIQTPEKSYETQMEMVAHVERLLEKLELPYRILRLCGGDATFAAAMTFDFEVYSAAQKRWLEVSSVSNFETYQSNRLKLRYRDENGKTQLAHTLNGSALALARIVASLLENHQTPEGIKIPKALIPYTRFDIIN